MSSAPRKLALAQIAGGTLALGAGTLLTVTTGVALLGVGFDVLATWISYVGIFGDPRPRPMPALDALWPSVGLVAGISLFLVGWVAIIRGAAHAWPARFDRSAP